MSEPYDPNRPAWPPPTGAPTGAATGPHPGWPPPPPYAELAAHQLHPAHQGYPAGPPRRRSRLPLALGAAAAALTIGVAVAVPLVLADDEPTERGAGTGSTGSTGSTRSDPTDLSEVQVFEDLPTTHVEEPVTYDQSPPAGGPHFPAWLECGVYDDEVPDEVAVHDLEHGTFWFTYDAEALDVDAVRALAAQLPDNGIMSPYADLEAPVVVMVWERQLALTGPEDPRLGLFLDEYAAGETAPEPGASCAGGLSAEEADDAVGIETF